MKKVSKLFLAVLLSAAVLSACGAKEEEPVIVIEKQIVHTDKQEESPIEVYVDPNLPPEGTYFNELSGIPIPLELKEQRPIAAMVDNEILAYPHIGVQQCDIVYEMINSTQNNRITRLMALAKDYNSIPQLGSIRSTRDTNIWLQAEYNSILCHDGSSAISLPYFNNGYARDHISGTFARIDNGKAREFTEYIVTGDVDANIAAQGFSKDYNEFRPERESHFVFVPYSEEEVMTGSENKECTFIDLSSVYPHNSTQLYYNPDTSTYDYYNYGFIHEDGNDGSILSFKNVILQNIEMYSTDDAGHVAHTLVDSGKKSYYISNGHVQEITWTKTDEMSITKYYDLEGNELVINRGNTYIAFVPTDGWDTIIVE